jgi:hypothetical protein
MDIDKYISRTSGLATITGYVSGLAKYGDEIPTRIRVRMLQMLIDEWRKMEPNDEAYTKWCDEWEKVIKEISA